MQKSPFIDKVVPANFVDTDDIRCPDCQGNNLVLGGFVQKTYAVVYTNGVVTDEELSPDPYVHDVRVIQCQNPKCLSITRVISQELWETMQVASAGKGMLPC